MEPPQDEDMMEARQQIQDFILRGEIQSAIEALNELDPLVSNPPRLHQLSPLFMIRPRVLYMHHAYGFRTGDEKQPPFYDFQKQKAIILYVYVSVYGLVLT